MVIVGFLLGITVAVALASLGIIITGSVGILRENLITGAVIGTNDAISYAIVALIISVIATFFLILILRKPKVTVF